MKRAIFPLSRPPRKATRGFTLAQTMIALAIFGIGSTVLLETFTASIFLTAKNTTLNLGNTSLRKSYQPLLTALESAAMVTDCANYDQTTRTFTAVAAGSWGNSVRFMNQVPISLYIMPEDGSGYSVIGPTPSPPPPTRRVSLRSTTQTILLAFNPSLYSANAIPTSAQPLPASARFYPAFPSVSESVSGGTSPGVNKPGLAISSYTYYAANTGRVGITLANPLGSNSVLDCNRAYLFVERAFAVIQNATDLHKELLYFPDTSQTTNFITICPSLDGANQTQPHDSSIPSGGTAGSFCIPLGSDSVQTLLPIRSVGYSNVMSRRGGAAARNDNWININTKFRHRQDL